MNEEFGMGFSACEAPMTVTKQYEKTIQKFVESGSDAMSCSFDEEKKAKSMQSALARVVRASFKGAVKVRREGNTVFVVKAGE